jgi:hypothetical protein
VAFGTSTSAWKETAGTSTQNYVIAGIRKASNGSEAVGVVSTKAGLTLSATINSGIPVALSGRVSVKVTAENGEITAGDYLTVSASMPGYAMKMTGEGRSIGRAISDYIDGQDKVMMVVENGYQKVDATGRYATTTGMLTTGNIDLNANGVGIYNIKSLASANGSWSIDENGRIVARVLCLEDVCIGKEQLSNILNSTGQTGIVAGTSTTGTVESQPPVDGTTTGQAANIQGPTADSNTAATSTTDTASDVSATVPGDTTTQATSTDSTTPATDTAATTTPSSDPVPAPEVVADPIPVPDPAPAPEATADPAPAPVSDPVASETPDPTPEPGA